MCSIEQCSCGVLHVTIGVLTIRLHPDVVASIWETFGDALAAVAHARDEARARNVTDRPS